MTALRSQTQPAFDGTCGRDHRQGLKSQSIGIFVNCESPEALRHVCNLMGHSAEGTQKLKLKLGAEGTAVHKVCMTYLAKDAAKLWVANLEAALAVLGVQLAKEAQEAQQNAWLGAYSYKIVVRVIRFCFIYYLYIYIF